MDVTTWHATRLMQGQVVVFSGVSSAASAVLSKGKDSMNPNYRSSLELLRNNDAVAEDMVSTCKTPHQKTEFINQ